MFIINQGTRDACFSRAADGYLYKSGNIIKSVKLCDKIQDKELKTQCYLNNPFYDCLKLEKKDEKDQCYFVHASEGNPSQASPYIPWCDKIVDQTTKTQCYDMVLYKVSMMIQNTDLCYRIVDGKTRDKCMLLGK